jgi:hypothetical protein
MPVKVFEDVWEARFPVVEPVAFGESTMGAFPLTALHSTGSELRQVSVVVLENGRLRVAVCPSLGGRVVTLDGAMPSVVEAVGEGPRSCSLACGVQFTLAPGSDAMASFDHLVHESDTECAVMVFGSVAGQPLSLQVVYTLLPDADELLVEARVFNRSLSPQRFSLAAVEVGGTEDVVSESVLAPRDTRAFRLRLGQGATGINVHGIEQNDRAAIGLEEHDGTDPASLPIHLRGAAHLRSAGQFALVGDYRAALEQCDSALATLGDDPLTWWQRAVLARLVGERDDDSPELAAAHALSPLEPVLRAEAFLSIPQTHGKEPSTVLKPLANDPDALHECVHLYIEAGFLSDASRLIDEALRHGEHPLLRYMHAWTLMKHTRMEMEAATEVTRAAKSPLQPPFPWRPLEVQAVEDLHARFTKDERINALYDLLLKRNGPAN